MLPATTPANGRPTKYHSDYAEQAYHFALLGYTDKQIAEAFGISRSTLSLWKKQFSDFSDTLRRGKIVADAEIAKALFNRAKGYSYQSEKLMVVNGTVERHPITVYLPPDANACLQWLKNRQPELWRDKQSPALSGDITFTLNLDG